MRRFTIRLTNREGRSPAGHYPESQLTRRTLEEAETDALSLLTGRHQRENEIIGYQIFTEGIKVVERTVF